MNKSIFGCVILLFAGVLCGHAQAPLTNGYTHQGLISPAGDADSWTFTANVGDAIILRVGEITATNNFSPRIRLQNPSAV